MFLRKKLMVAAGSLVFSALALTACTGGANIASPAPAADGAVQSSAASGSAAGDGMQADGTSKSNSTSVDAAEIRAGVHGNEERVVFDFTNVPHASGLKLTSHQLNQEVPAWGESAKRVEGMGGSAYLHVYVQLTDSDPHMSGVVQFGQKLAKSAVVNNNYEGTAELTVALSKGVDYEVLVEGQKVIINMTDGPMGR